MSERKILVNPIPGSYLTVNSVGVLHFKKTSSWKSMWPTATLISHANAAAYI
jgi:hypothetical protein